MPIAENDRPLDGISYLSDISGPAVFSQTSADFIIESFDGFSGVLAELLQKVIRNWQNVWFPIAQRRQHNRIYINAIIKVLSKGALLNHLFEILIGGKDEPNIYPYRCCRAHRQKFARF